MLLYDVLVVVAGAICCAMSGIVMVMNAIFLVEYKEAFDIDTETAAWSSSIFGAASYLCGNQHYVLDLF